MNKRGFTLIELLAVIVILAIIALIAVPQVTNTVSNSKNRTQEISAENYVRALKKSIAAYNLEKKFEPEVCEYEEGITTCDDVEINVEFSGNLESATVIFAGDEVIYYIVNFGNNEYVVSGETPDSCFISSIDGEIGGYICDYDIVVFGKNLKLGTITEIESLKYNDEKCKAHNSSDLCLDVKSIIESLEKKENIGKEELIEMLANNPELNFLKDNPEYLAYALGSVSSAIDISLNTSNEKHLINKIGLRAFENKNLKIVSLNNTIETIDTQAFYQNQIRYLILQNGLKYIGWNAFLNNDLERLTIPETVKLINISAFAGASDNNLEHHNNIKYLKLKNGIEEIGAGAFANNSIQKLDLPSSIKKIGDFSFGSNKIIELNIPEGVESIGMSAFKDNHIIKLNLPSSLNNISSGAFDENCLTEGSIVNNSSVTLDINYSNQNACRGDN